jgi:hypothetical protein
VEIHEPTVFVLSANGREWSVDEVAGREHESLRVARPWRGHMASQSLLLPCQRLQVEQIERVKSDLSLHTHTHERTNERR